MPTYEYKCEDCKQIFFVSTSVTEHEKNPEMEFWNAGIMEKFISAIHLSNIPAFLCSIFIEIKLHN